MRSVRRDLVERIGRCECCGRRAERWQDIHAVLHCHEILNGPLRDKTLDEPCSLLVTCWTCNSEKLTDKKEWPIERQLALILKSDPERFDLKRFLWLRNPNAPEAVTTEDIREWMDA